MTKYWLQLQNNMQKKRGALEISFGWIFAIIVGIVVIFLAIYLSTRLISTEQTTTGAETSKKIGILTNPLETGFESAKTSSFTLAADTRITNNCDYFTEPFGEQKIKLAEKSFNQWKETNLDISFQNKYFFSGNDAEGKTFFVFSKPFEFPFKIADLIYLTSSSEKYCFIDYPQEIGEEICNLNQGNIILVGEKLCQNQIETECPQNGIKVCFGFESDCDAVVKGTYVKKGDEKMYFENSVALMYAGIFSSPEVYECQIIRLMRRASEIASLYKEKGETLASRGCGFNLDSELTTFSSLTKNAGDSSSLEEISGEADNLESLNEMSECLLW